MHRHVPRDCILDKLGTALFLKAESGVIFPSFAKTELALIILNVPVIEKRLLKFSTSRPSFVFRVGVGSWGRREKEHFPKSKGLKWLGFHSFDLFSITRPGRVQKKMLNN